MDGGAPLCAPTLGPRSRESAVGGETRARPLAPPGAAPLAGPWARLTPEPSGARCLTRRPLGHCAGPTAGQLQQGGDTAPRGHAATPDAPPPHLLPAWHRSRNATSQARSTPGNGRQSPAGPPQHKRPPVPSASGPRQPPASWPSGTSKAELGPDNRTQACGISQAVRHEPPCALRPSGHLWCGSDSLGPGPRPLPPQRGVGAMGK